MNGANALYERYRAAIDGEPLPLALCDLDAFDRNVDRAVAVVAAQGKTLRIASKSLRNIGLMKRVQARGGATVRGVLAFAAREAPFLVEHGFEDVIVGYPTGLESDAKAVAAANANGATVAIVADCAEHLELLGSAARARGVTIPVVVDVDVSYRLLGGALHIGVRRSPLRTVAAVLAFAERVAATQGLGLHGVMAYEAHLAGLPDKSPFARLSGPAVRALKRRAGPLVREFRAEIVEGLRRRSLLPAVVNGGGSGSLAWSCDDAALSEVTVGSAFVGSHLFDYFDGLGAEPAVLFALQVVRKPDRGIVTCHGGGYVASGEPGAVRLPLPYLPEGLAYLSFEGAGEVQTPLSAPQSLDLPIGSPVFFRHTKAGELAEHFSEYVLVEGARLTGRHPTYRGMSRAFL